MNIEKVVLPTNGLVGYEREITIRAMKGRQLSTILSSLDDGAIDKVIEDIIEPKIGINELTDEDKTFILHKARELTFGGEIKQNIKCPLCGEIHEYTMDYQDFSITYLEPHHTQLEYTTEFNGKQYTFTNKIPTGDTWQEVEQYKKRFNPPTTLSYIMVLATRINRINGTKWSMSEKVNLLADVLPANVVVELQKEFDIKYGFDPTYVVECPTSRVAFTGGLAITADLFR